ncbi:DUF202 domain-containing protein [Humibacter ginsenosidimutans]|uniref:DUF202 domain-containing protein n=1 Tax=Humibacter ginsenosidimutans TaxID=2599293 RepID=A0A5B8M2U4_9MICO|nr:DUF202 domain-containing protein [Humibacter ginsenosidimutans]QDZ14481.1 DUF202 domain-containing protein [Humibacter ginsenosidimutans]
MTGPTARDSGLQGERTALSWSRTCLALAVNGLVVFRAGWESGVGVLTMVGALLVASAVALTIFGNARGRALSGHGRHHDRIPSAAPAVPLVLLTAAALVACGAGIACTLVER